MSKVKRYDFEEGAEFNGMCVFDNGGYVQYTDYQALLKRVEKAASNKDYPSLPIEGALESLVKQRKEIEALEKELEEAKEEGRKDKRFRERCFAGPHEMWIKAAEDAEQLNERYKTALEFYRDENYKDIWSPSGPIYRSPINEDKGKIAREALTPNKVSGDKDEQND